VNSFYPLIKRDNINPSIEYRGELEIIYAIFRKILKVIFEQIRVLHKHGADDSHPRKISDLDFHATIFDGDPSRSI
jgi:hypothetical protein